MFNNNLHTSCIHQFDQTIHIHVLVLYYLIQVPFIKYSRGHTHVNIRYMYACSVLTSRSDNTLYCKHINQLCKSITLSGKQSGALVNGPFLVHTCTCKYTLR